MDSVFHQTNTNEPGVETHTPGSLLASERLRQGLSVGDVAAKLRMGIVQVDALERGDYGKLPTGTFLRGFVRSYAKLLGIEPGLVVGLLEQTLGPSTKPPLVVSSQNIRYTAPREHFATPKVRGALFVIFLLTLSIFGWYWWEYIRPAGLLQARSQAAPQTTAERTENVDIPSLAVTEPRPEQAVVENTPAESTAFLGSATIVAPQSARDATGAARIEPVIHKPIAPGSATLRFTFSGESWVEVVEGSGKVLISRRYKAGDEEVTSSKGPLSVIIGNASVTRMNYNGSDFDLTPHTRISVARFTLK